MPAPGLELLLADNVFGHPEGQTLVIELRAGSIAAVREITVGDAEALLSGSQPETAAPPVLDLRGKLVLPGLIDAHVHAIATGMLMLTQDVRAVESLDALEAAIRAEAAKGTPAVRLGGLDRSKWPAAELARLDRAWLDGQVSDRVLFIKSIEGH